MNEQGLLVVFSGPSGVGKDTLLKRLIEKRPEIRLSISATTRSPRVGEEHGKDYFFMTREKFQSLLAQDKMLEHAEYCGNYYGTPSEPIEKWLSQGHDVILEIEVQGGSQVLQKRPESVSIFVLPPSVRALEERLRSRGTESEETIQKRLSAAKEEMSKAHQYAYAVVNDDLDEAANEIAAILCAEKRRSQRNKEQIERMLRNA